MKNFFQFIPIILFGWVVVFIRLVGSFVNFWLEKTIIIKILSITLLLQFIFSSRPWFFYEIQLTEVKEIIFVSSKSNLYFILTSIACLFFNFSNSKKIILFSLLLQIFQGVFFLFGDSNANLVHIDFLLSSDYNHSANYLLYAGLLILNSILFLFKFI